MTIDPTPKPYFGYAAVIGRPNVGKSTLINHLIGEKINITSRKPQTTRHQVLGIFSEPAGQMILVDTPGIHKHERRTLNRFMNRAAWQALAGVNVVVWLLTAEGISEEDQRIGELIQQRNEQLPLVIAVNKIDQIDKPLLLPLLAQIQERYAPEHIVPISALKQLNLDRLQQLLRQFMPIGAPQFDTEQLTDRSLRFLAAERIREKLTRQLGDELPHELAVQIESFTEDATLARIHGLILVERASQKSIVIGKGGERLKSVGSQARQELEQLFDKKVMLELWVKVKTGWTDDERSLTSLGYDPTNPQ